MKFGWVCKWYDLWIGLYWDSAKRRMYVLPLPCLGFWVEWPEKFDPRTAGKWGWLGGKQVVIDSVEVEVLVYHEANAIARPYRSHVRGLGPKDCPGCLWMWANIDPKKYDIVDPAKAFPRAPPGTKQHGL